MTIDSKLEATAPGQVTDQALRAEDQEPGSVSEKYMASLWSEIIGLDRVILSHKFLAVGGNSLTLNIILNRIEAETGVSLDALLFYDEERSSLFELSKELEMLREKTSDRSGLG